MKITSILAALLALAASPVFAEDPAPPPPPGGEAPDGKGRPHMVPPLFAALDTDRDGEISADEIANAAESLKALDKNGDGKLTHEELAPMPPHPPEGGEAPDGQQAPPKGQGKPPKVKPQKPLKPLPGQPGQGPGPGGPPPHPPGGRGR